MEHDPQTRPGTLFIFGLGYSAEVLARRLLPLGWRVVGTTRDAAKARRLQVLGVEPILWPAPSPEHPVAEALGQATHLLSSVGAVAAGDPVLQAESATIAQVAPRLTWAGYLSTTGVYGDHGGGWVDEDTALAPTTERGRWRLQAERAWAAIPALPIHHFRLAGIYGPGRGPFLKVRDGSARLILKDGQFMSRIHVEDIATVLAASMARPAPGRAYNVCDDLPSAPEDVLREAARLLDLPPPPAVRFEEAEMSPIARGFYSESKRVRNGRIKDELGVRLAYPTYREGLRAILAAERSGHP